MVHLNTLVGGRSVVTLRAMLEHYRNLGVESFIINVHLTRQDDPLLDEVCFITKDFGVPIASVAVGEWLQVLRRVYKESRTSYPDDWHILADNDELQVYPMALSELEIMCKEKNYDYVCGCWVDRLSADGKFPQIDSSRSLWDQFPLGAFLSYPVGAADPRKVVFAKSNVDVCLGQHFARNGRCCPITEVFVQVHHFKWVGGIIAELEKRAETLKEAGYGFYVEASRFLKYFANNGGAANVTDPLILAAKCEQNYEHWPLIQNWFTLLNDYIALGRHFIPGPANLLINRAAVEQNTSKMLSDIKSERGEHHRQGSDHEEPIFGLEVVRQIWLNSWQ